MTKICKRCGKREAALFDNMCYSCRSEQSKDDTVEAIRDGEDEVDTGSSDYVICPYCGDATPTDVGYEDFPALYEEGDHEIECTECGRTFVLSSLCGWYYETSKMEDSDGVD